MALIALIAVVLIALVLFAATMGGGMARDDPGEVWYYLSRRGGPFPTPGPGDEPPGEGGGADGVDEAQLDDHVHEDEGDC
jgi:hypothetical protein